jgi:hypothetical protein
LGLAEQTDPAIKHDVETGSRLALDEEHGVTAVTAHGGADQQTCQLIIPDSSEQRQLTDERCILGLQAKLAKCRGCAFVHE